MSPRTGWLAGMSASHAAGTMPQRVATRGIRQWSTALNGRHIFSALSVPLPRSTWLNGRIGLHRHSAARIGARTTVGENGANPSSEGKSLRDALSDLLPQPLSAEGARTISDVAELVAFLVSWRESMRLALGALKKVLLPRHCWMKAVRLIAAHLGAGGKNPRTVLRLLDPPKEAKRRIAPPQDDGAVASDQQTVTGQLIKQETKRVGRKIRSEVPPESDPEFCQRMARLSSNQFPTDSESGRRGAVRLLQILAEELQLSPADLLEAQSQPAPASSEAAGRLPS